MCALVALGYVTAEEKDLAIILLVVAIGINSATYLGFQVCKIHCVHFKLQIYTILSF